MPIGLIILFALIGVPILEIYVFVAVGSEIGALATIALTLLTAVAGTIMLRVQGFSLLMRIRAEIDAGRVPGDDLVHGALIVVAAILLLVPGFVTDAIGLILFIPPVRSAIGHYLVSHADMTIVSSGGMKRSGEKVVDLDEDDWSSRPGNGFDDGPRDGMSGDTPRISPWRDKP